MATGKRVLYVYTKDSMEASPWVLTNDYGVSSNRGYLKVGDTTKSADGRIKQQKSAETTESLRKIWDSTMIAGKPGVDEQGRVDFRDHAVHAALRDAGHFFLHDIEGNSGEVGTEWVEATLDDVLAAIGRVLGWEPPKPMVLRPEQEEAVLKTTDYFSQCGPNGRFLWNAKMRFGKTFATYSLVESLSEQLEAAGEQGLSRVLIMTFIPAVEDGWRDDLYKKFGKDWRFVTSDDTKKKGFSGYGPHEKVVRFVSLQDAHGLDTNKQAAKKHNADLHETSWDLVVIDEYHFGAHRMKTQAMLDGAAVDIEIDDDQELDDSGVDAVASALSYLDRQGIDAQRMLFLSGTPFRILQRGDFADDQVFTWTYSDEQSRKKAWEGPGNPYAHLPEMQIVTARIDADVDADSEQGVGVDLRDFLKATGRGAEAKFVNEEQVKAWLESLANARRSDSKGHRLVSNLVQEERHSLWFLPSVAACDAMERLLGDVFRNKTVINASGANVPAGVKALQAIRPRIGGGLKTETITLTCGKLVTGVTVPQWSLVVMLAPCDSPERYFQTVFRAQSPWVANVNGVVEDFKRTCFVIDFDQQRALRMAGSYAMAASSKDGVSPESSIKALIEYMPIIAAERMEAREVSAEDIMDAVLRSVSNAGHRWGHSRLVNFAALSTFAASNQELASRLLRIDPKSVKSVEIEVGDGGDVVQNDKDPGPEGTDSREKEAKESTTQSDIERLAEAVKTVTTRLPLFVYLTEAKEQSLAEVVSEMGREQADCLAVVEFSQSDVSDMVRARVLNVDQLNYEVMMLKRLEDRIADWYARAVTA